jgi:uncharacterized protein YqgV (UPF0045/DUF77 family)
METDVLLAPLHNNVDGIFANRCFRLHLRDGIERVISHDDIVLERGQKFKRTPWDTLIEKDMMNITSIIEEYKKVKQKTSKLQSGCRDAVSRIVEKAVDDMFDTYRNINCMK